MLLILDNGQIWQQKDSKTLVASVQLSDGTDIVIRPEDAEIEQAFIRRLSSESRYFRFMNSISELSLEMLVRFTQIDYHNEMALIAVWPNDDGEEEIGVVRYMAKRQNRNHGRNH